jgi:flavin-dependent dehydrogenase
MNGGRLLVVGGGPAGLCAAIRGASEGLQVTLIDRRTPPIDKACGEGLMPDGLERLRGLGVTLLPGDGQAFRGIRYVGNGRVAEGRFSGGPGMGIRRTVLHERMSQRAEELGVELRWGVTARGFTEDGVETDTGRLRADWYIGADGLHSPMRRWAGLDAAPGPDRRFGLRTHFAIAPWTDRVEVHWADDSEAYVTPVGPRGVGVALLWRGAEGGGWTERLARFPALVERLGEAPELSVNRGAGPLDQRVRGVIRGGLALIGDAGGYVDAITGEGLALAFHEGFAVIDAIRHGDLGRFVAARRKIRRLPEGMTRSLLAVERRPRLRDRLLRTLAGDPDLFSRLLDIHAGSRPARRLGVDGVRLAWRFLSV